MSLPILWEGNPPPDMLYAKTRRCGILTQRRKEEQNRCKEELKEVSMGNSKMGMGRRNVRCGFAV